MTFQYEKDIFFGGRLFADVLVFSEQKLSKSGEEALNSVFTNEEIGAAALRVTPNECAYYCDPVSLETSFAYNAAFAVKASSLAAVGGADKRMGVYAASELIARLKAKGLKTVYCPRADVRLGASLAPPYADRLFDGALFRNKCGTREDMRAALIMKLKAFRHPEAYGIGRGEWLKRELAAVFSGLSLSFGKLGKDRLLKGSVEFESASEAGLVRGEYETEEIEETPLVSVITRTRNRPETLRKTLESLRHQTYGNFEVVVVEDGEPLSEEMIKSDFSDLNITYKATVKNIGRAAAANLGFSLAKGEFLNLLDDDDYFLPEHIEVGVKKALADGADVVFLKGIALEINKKSDVPYEIEVVNKNRLDFPRIDPFTMVRRCVTTQNGVMFRRSLCERVGGMRNELGAHEDWNLFLRLMAHGRYSTAPYASCCYIVPADKETEKKRLEGYAKFDTELLRDEKLVFSIERNELVGYRESVIHDYMYLLSLGLASGKAAEEEKKRREFYEDKKLLTFMEIEERDFPISLTGDELRQLYFSEIDLIYESEKEGRLSSYIENRYSELLK